MKVYIGKYLDFWGPYQIFALLRYLGFSKETTDAWAEKSPEWFTNLCQWVYDKRKRKVKVKLHSYDTWGADHTLALIIVPMLEQLKKDKHGTPMSMFLDEDGLDEWGSPTPSSHAKAEERWQLTLGMMIWAFKQVIDEDYESFQIVAGEMDLSKHPEDEGKTCVPLRWSVEPKTNWNACWAYHERIQEGLDLFSKNYQNLWS